MLTKTKIVVIAAVLLGSASSAFALDPDCFDVDIFRPSPTAAWAGQPQRATAAQSQRGFVQAPARLSGGHATVAPVTAGELAIMERASRSYW